jgi:hypothetical protein
MKRVRLSVLTIAAALAIVVTGLAIALTAQPAPTGAPAASAADPAAKLPAAVTGALKSRCPKAAITKVEKPTSGETVSYELGLEGATVKSIELTADGKPLPAAKK